MLKPVISKSLDALGYEVKRKRKNTIGDVPMDMEADKAAIIKAVAPYTMTSAERVYSLIGAVDYVLERGIKGDIVECGVWRGGSMLSVAMRLKEHKTTDRTLWLYDTYEGMSAPDENDFSKRSGGAQAKFEETQTGDDSSDWCCASLEDVQANIKLAKYPAKNIKFVKGKVEDTIPKDIPEKIALLRLDTDWYASTKHEMEHLFPRLVKGGVLIIDDYGHWEGCRKAVDEYFEAHPKNKPLLVRVDYTGRIGIKP